MRCVVLLLCGVAMAGSRNIEEKLHGEGVGYVDVRVSYTAEAEIYHPDTSGSFTLVINYGDHEKRIRATVTAADADGKFKIRNENGDIRGSGQCHISDEVFRLKLDDDYYFAELHPFRICKLHFTDPSMNRIKLTKLFGGDDEKLLLISGTITRYGSNLFLNWESLTGAGERRVTYCWEENDLRYNYPCMQ